MARYVFSLGNAPFCVSLDPFTSRANVLRAASRRSRLQHLPFPSWLGRLAQCSVNRDRARRTDSYCARVALGSQTGLGRSHHGRLRSPHGNSLPDRGRRPRRPPGIDSARLDCERWNTRGGLRPGNTYRYGLGSLNGSHDRGRLLRCRVPRDHVVVVEKSLNVLSSRFAVSVYPANRRSIYRTGNGWDER